jgi:serine phosphatase RsbU (regulator of sigma subunit)
MYDREARLDLRALLDAVEAAPPTDGVGALAAELAKAVGAGEVSFLIADISGGALARLVRAQPHEAPVQERTDVPATVPIAGTPAGLALRSQQVQLAVTGDEVWLWAPVTERGEAVGVLELVLPTLPDEQTVAYLASAAHALAYVVIAGRRYTDLYEWGQRGAPLSLAAEIQRRLLPGSYTCEAGQFTLAGWLMPAHTAGGDTFDYALDRDTLHLSITDAMGHGVDAAQLATLVVGSLRNSRRRGLGLPEQARAASTALASHARPDQFVTGTLLQVDLATGRAAVVNAGHVLPLRVRRGQVSQLNLQVDPVLGVLPDADYRLQQLALEPGDRLVLLTDGMLERNAAGAHVVELLATLVELHPREAVQTLTGTVVQATGGKLLDDATVLVLDWYGGLDQARAATAGATSGRASR